MKRRRKTHAIKRQGKNDLYEPSSGNGGGVDGDEIQFNPDDENFPDEIALTKKPSFIDEEMDSPINLIGDKETVSDASMAIRALLGEGGDFRAGSEINDNQVRALLVLLDVAEELNSPRLLKTAENFLLLSISKSGTGRKQVVGAFKGLYEPNNQPGQNDAMPSGHLRGVR